MPVLEIITIGTELLLGEIPDTNSTYIARKLRDHGIDIYRITTIGDNLERITAAIKEALKRADIIITTGGLGPTVDDPTRQAVADATDRDLVFINALWDQIEERFKAYGRKPTQNNQRQAFIPEGAIPITNPVGTAPCFIVELGSACVISLPGVPREMEYLLHHEIIPFLKGKFRLKTQIIKAAVLHAASIGESMVDELIADLEEKTNPSVGLLAHPGQVDIRVTAKASSEAAAAEMTKPVIEELHKRLGDNVYGQNGITLEMVVCDLLKENGLNLAVLEYGLGGTLWERINNRLPKVGTMIVLTIAPVDLDGFSRQVREFRTEKHCEIGFGVALILDKQVTFLVVYQDANRSDAVTRLYGGHRENASLWAQNIGLDFLRRNLIQITGKRETGEL